MFAGRLLAAALAAGHLALSLAASATAAEAAPLSTADRATLIRQLAADAGLTAGAAEVQRQASHQATETFGAAGAAETGELAELFAEAFAADRLSDAVTGRLVTDFEPAHVERVLAWQRGAIARKIRAANTAGSGEQGEREIAAYAQQLEIDEPPSWRITATQRIDAASNVSQQQTEIAVQLSHALSEAMNQLLDPDGSESRARHDLADSLRETLRPTLEGQMAVTLLYTTRTLSRDELDAYVAFAESDAARWLGATAFRGLAEAIADGRGVFRGRFSGWAASRLAPERLAKARAEAAAFAAESSDLDCVPEVFRRDASCREVACHAGSAAFFRRCLTSSKPTELFCDGVPEPESATTTHLWRSAICSSLGRTDHVCRILMGATQDYCSERPAPEKDGSV